MILPYVFDRLACMDCIDHVGPVKAFIKGKGLLVEEIQAQETAQKQDEHYARYVCSLPVHASVRNVDIGIVPKYCINGLRLRWAGRPVLRPPCLGSFPQHLGLSPTTHERSEKGLLQNITGGEFQKYRSKIFLSCV